MAGDVTDEGAISVLDLGTEMVKALVVKPAPGRVIVLAAAAVPAPPAEPFGTRSLDGLLAACERALIAAEDAAGAVPVRAFFGVTAQRAAIAAGEVEAQRTRPATLLSAEELRPLLRRAEQSALATARRRDAAEFPTPTALHALGTALADLEVDGRSMDDLGGAGGKRLHLSLAAAFAPRPVVDETALLAERLDLEIGGVLLAPFALGGALAGAGHGPALVVDVGADLTQVVLLGERWAEALVTVPLGGSGLVARVAAELGLSPQAAHDATVAHCAGAATSMAGGAGAARAVRQVAKQHAEVWLDALGVACVGLGRTGILPARLLLCGGAAGLPEIKRALQETNWHAGLPFEVAPAARWLTPRDLPSVIDRSGRLPALQTVPVLGLAAAAAGACGAAAALDALLRL